MEEKVGVNSFWGQIVTTILGVLVLDLFYRFVARPLYGAWKRHHDIKGCISNLSTIQEAAASRLKPETIQSFIRAREGTSEYIVGVYPRRRAVTFYRVSVRPLERQWFFWKSETSLPHPLEIEIPTWVGYDAPDRSFASLHNRYGNATDDYGGINFHFDREGGHPHNRPHRFLPGKPLWMRLTFKMTRSWSGFISVRITSQDDEEFRVRIPITVIGDSRPLTS